MKNQLIISAITGATAVIFGALGAHYLEGILDASGLESFETAVRYQTLGALFLLVLSLFGMMTGQSAKWPFLLMFFGILLFSGSIYVLVFTKSAGLAWGRFFGPVTPIGGLLMITAWIALVSSIKVPKKL